MTLLFRAGTRAVVVGIAVLLSSGCGDFVRQSRSPSQLVINSLLAASGSGTVPTAFVSGPLLSDVVAATGTIFDDFGQVTMSAILRDQGTTAVTPTAVNDVTITRYRVVYRRSDGRNQPGLDVPYSFDGGMSVTVPAGGGATVTTVFELVRHVAKAEAPLLALRSSAVVLSTIAEITFFGRDQAGNEMSVTGSVQVNFANFN